MTSNNLVLKFDPQTIQHLGISLYSQLPNVLAELVSNSWDADAESVEIRFFDNEEGKKIVYRDTGIGMSFEELNDKYLVIGRNRRIDERDTTSKGRKVIGKKGLGKLSVFGICNVISVRTVQNGTLNEFQMNLSDIKQSTDTHYYPEIISANENTNETSGTQIILSEIRRKSPFDCKKIAQSLSKKFLIFDELKTVLIHNESEETLVTNELKFDGFEEEFAWDFPLEGLDVEYEMKESVSGRVITLKTPIRDTEMKGIYLTSRGKLVNKAEFYGLRDTDQFHTYVTGYLEVDFIDELESDVISTDRQSLNWETDETKALRDYLQAAIKKIASDWKRKRRERKKDDIRDDKDLDISAWQNTLPSYEKELSQKIIDPILENDTIDINDSSEIIGNVIDKFENQTFKKYASHIADLDKPEEIPMLLKLMDDWKAVEARQYCDLAIARVEVINKFESYIESNTREVPTLHNFLKQFSWLLDPRILEFRDEVTYSRLLKENFPDEDLDEPDRRIDFLCSNALGGILYVIEIKRSQYRIDINALEQAWDYQYFLTERYSSPSGFNKVVSFLVGGEKSMSGKFNSKEETYRNAGQVYVKTYRELLEQSKQYHREFIDIYRNGR